MLTSLSSTSGDNMGGYLPIKLCPIEWIASPIVLNVNTNTVRQPVVLLAGKELLTLTFQTDSLKFSEKPKESTAGDYYEQVATAIMNLDEPTMNLVLDEYRFHRWLVILPDQNGRSKIIGNKQYGMKIASSLEVDADPAGKSAFEVTFTFESEHKAPFYEI